MGPDFIIQHVIAAQGGEWYTKGEEPEDEDAAARRLPDEGLPMVKPEIIQHLEGDTYDPESGRLVETIRSYEKHKEALHDQVKFIFARQRNNNEQTISKAKDMRITALNIWDQVEAQVKQKVKDDSLISEFGEGQRFRITLLGAENLPMFDQVQS